MKNIVVINGTGGSGKDTFVKCCSKYKKVMNFSSIDKIKERAKLHGWTGEKTEKDRKFLSELKKITTEYNNFSFNSLVEAVKLFELSDNEILFIHIREPEEIEKFINTFPSKTLLIKRKGLENIKTNYTDASVDKYSYDYIIENNSLEELENLALDFINKITIKNKVLKKC